MPSAGTTTHRQDVDVYTIHFSVNCVDKREDTTYRDERKVKTMMRLHGKKCKACREAWDKVKERQDRMKWNFDRCKDYDEYCRTIASSIVKT